MALCHLWIRVSIRSSELVMLLDGVDRPSVKRRPRYAPESALFAEFPGVRPFPFPRQVNGDKLGETKRASGALLTPGTSLWRRVWSNGKSE